VAPVPVNVAEFPLHINVGELVAVSVGVPFTVKRTVLVFEQPVALAPVTV
jgi:hypothetical protein